MNKNGQALVEFVILLPILIIIIFASIDFGIITYNKIKLENTLNDVVNIVYDKTEDEIKKYVNINNKDVDYYVTKQSNYMIIHLTKEININTPGLNKILGSPYKIKVSRVIYDE